MAAPGPLKIAEAKIRNFRRARLIELKPESNFIIIAGKNAQGKTSLLDAIACGLSGTKPDYKRAVYGSEEKGEIEITLTNGIHIRQYVTNAGGYGLKVTTADGGVMTAGATFLSKFYDALQFEPMNFVRKAPKDQVEMLKNLAGIDFSKIDQEIEEHKAIAKNQKAEWTRIEGLMSNLPDRDILDGAPDKEVSITELTKKLNEVQESNRVILDAKNMVTRLESDIARADEGIAELKARIAKIEEDKKSFLAKIEQIKKDHSSFEIEGTEEITAAIELAEVTNRLVRTKIERNNARLAHKSAADKEFKANEAIKALTAKKKKLLEEAQFPITGLSFDEEGVLFEGIPLDERSASEQVRVCLAIAKATRKQMSVLIIRDASLLDEDAIEEVRNFAEDNDIQVLMEVVGTDVDSSAIVIEDGMVAEKVGA